MKVTPVKIGIGLLIIIIIAKLLSTSRGRFITKNAGEHNRFNLNSLPFGTSGSYFSKNYGFMGNIGAKKSCNCGINR